MIPRWTLPAIGLALGSLAAAQDQASPAPLDPNQFWFEILECQRSGDAAKAEGHCRTYAPQCYAESVFQAMLANALRAEAKGDGDARDREIGSAEFLAAAARAAGIVRPAGRIATWKAADAAGRRAWADCLARIEEGEQLAKDQDPIRAAATFEKARALADAVADPTFGVIARRGLGMALWARREYPRARVAFREALAIADAATWFREETRGWLEELERKVREVGEPLLASPLLEEANLGPEEIVTLDVHVSETPPMKTPNPRTRDNPWFWRQVYLEDDKPGGGARVPGAEPLGVPGGLYLRKEPGDRVVSLTPDPAKPGTPVRLAPTPVLQRLSLPYEVRDTRGRPGRKTLDYGFQAVAPIEWRVWGQRRKTPPNPRWADIRVRRATYRVGRGPGGRRIALSDDDGNGQFDDVGSDGLGEAAGPATFLGCLLRLGDSWYRCENDRAGTALRLRPYKGPTGTVSVRWSGLEKAKLLWCVLEQRSGEARAYADVARSPAVIPCGSWALHYALLADDPDEEKQRRVEIRRGKHPGVELEPDGNAVLDLGGPVSMEIPLEPDEAGRVLLTDKAVVSGARGEAYSGFWPEPLLYEFDVRDMMGRSVAAGRVVPHGPNEEVPNFEKLAFAKPVAFPPGTLTGAGPWRVACRGSHPLLGEIAEPR
ncbi:MAG: tetratricopeptide repeat protein [Planctomycetales bacterium]|nr:tetratricopeptide repeat protein [Planctomycetales bacterium]